jgi:hypothetical protein
MSRTSHLWRRGAHQCAYEDSGKQSRRTKPMPNHEGSRLRNRQDILGGTCEGPDSRGEYDESVLHHCSDCEWPGVFGR